MTDTTTNNYEELIVGSLLGQYQSPSSYVVGLYDDSVDNIAAGDDIGAITSEPTGSNYARQQVDRANCQATTANGNRRLNLADVTFSTDDSGESIGSYFIMAEFNDGTNSNFRLISTGKIESPDYSVDLSNIDEYVLSNIYIEHAEQ